MATEVTGEQYRNLDGQILEIKRQLRQREGYPFDPELLKDHLQLAVEGKFGMPVVGDFKIATASFNVVKFFNENWKEVLEGEDKRSTDLTEVDFAKVRFVSCLDENENPIKGKKKFSRLKKNDNIRLGANVFLALWNDYQKKKENSILERLFRTSIIKNYIDFFGTILLDPQGYRYVLYFCRSDVGKWRWHARWLGLDWRAEDLSAVLPQV